MKSTAAGLITKIWVLWWKTYYYIYRINNFFIYCLCIESLRIMPHNISNQLMRETVHWKLKCINVPLILDQQVASTNLEKRGVERLHTLLPSQLHFNNQMLKYRTQTQRIKTQLMDHYLRQNTEDISRIQPDWQEGKESSECRRLLKQDLKSQCLSFDLLFLPISFLLLVLSVEKL